MKKLIYLANNLDALKKYSAADKVDEVIKLASSIKPVGKPLPGKNEDKNKGSQKPKERDGNNNEDFQKLLEDAMDAISEKEETSSYSQEKALSLEELLKLYNGD